MPHDVQEVTGTGLLDITTMIKASQTLSREVHLPSLLRHMMRIIMENAGATKGIFITVDDDTLLVQGKAVMAGDAIETMQAIPIHQSEDIPLSIINYTARTKTNLVLHDAPGDKTHANDPYIQNHKPISILCMPLRHLGKLSGLLYLENNLTVGAFTPSRIQLLEVLSSQATISMENASLYGTLEKKVQKRTDLLRKAMEALWGEMELAKKIQTALLPVTPSINGYDIAASLRAAKEVGGDYYDIISTGDRNWVVIGDVTGHGVSAGLIMMMVQTSIHTLLDAFPTATPSMVLAAVNRTIYKNIQRLGESKHMTLVILSAGSDGRFTFAGRHDDLMVWRTANRSVEVIKTTGMWVGITSDISTYLKDVDIILNPEDALVLYTDGITEARSQEDDRLFGGQLLAESIRALGDKSALDIHDGILGTLESYRTVDDIALVVIKRNP